MALTQKDTPQFARNAGKTCKHLTLLFNPFLKLWAALLFFDCGERKGVTRDVVESFIFSRKMARKGWCHKTFCFLLKTFHLIHNVVGKFKHVSMDIGLEISNSYISPKRCWFISLQFATKIVVKVYFYLLAVGKTNLVQTCVCAFLKLLLMSYWEERLKVLSQKVSWKD